MTPLTQTVQSANGAMDDETLIKKLRERSAGLAMFRAACRAQGYMADEDLEKPAADRIQVLREALQNIMGLFDTPIGRRQHSNDEFYAEAIAAARDALKAGGAE